jgi:alcohol dehydrogenase class IV
MRNYKVPYLIDGGVPIIAIPTTAGTGSEATRVAVISDTQTQEKMLCMGLGLMPMAALVDYELTLTMPYRLTADTGLDSLCHALEAYVSRKSNVFTDDVALNAMRSIYQNIRTACNQPDNRDAREAMMLAATQGGIAFANASVTLIHGMSRPIGADPRYEPAHRRAVSRTPWHEQRHAVTGDYRLVGKPCTGALCPLRPFHGCGAGERQR